MSVTSSPPKLGFIDFLFTHLGVEENLAPTLLIDWELCSYSDKVRTLCLKYRHNVERFERLEFQPVTNKVKVRAPLRVNGGAKVSSTLTYSRYTVDFEASDDPTQVRTALYTDPEDYNLYVTSRTVQVAEPTLQHVISGQDEEENRYHQRTIGSVPDVRGVALEVTNTLTDADEPESITNPRLVSTRLDIPASRDGLLAAPTITHDTSAKTPISIAWGLLSACCLGNDLLVLHTLKGLVAEFGRRSLDSPGFEETFAPGALEDDLRRDIRYNAVLGWSICHAIRYLNDRRPLNPELLKGSYVEFLPRLRDLLLSLGSLCAGAVVDGLGWCADSVEYGVYNYGVCSRAASYWSAIFFNELLPLVYDQYVHLQAAKLHLVLYEYDPDSNDLDPFLFKDTDDQVIADRAWWLWQIEDAPAVAHQYLKDSYGDGSQLTEYAKALSSYLWYNTKQFDTESLPDWVWSETKEEYALGLSAGLDTREYLPLTCLIYGYSLKAPANFDLKAHEAQALVQWVLSQLRRMWPTGLRWGSTEVINTTTSLLGSLFKAEAWLYFDYYLTKCLTDDANYLSRSQGPYSKGWLDLYTIADADHLMTDSFGNSYVDDYINRNKTDIELFIRLTLGYSDALVKYLRPRPYSLLIDDRLVSDALDNYTVEVNQLRGDQAFNELERRCIVYQPASRQLVNRSSTPNSASGVLINDWGGFGPRRRSGFPYRNQLVSSTELAAPEAILSVEYDELAIVPRLMYPPGTLASNNEIDCSYPEWTNPDLYVRDGTMLIKPLEQFVPVIEIWLDRPAGPDLKPILDKLITAGVTYVIKYVEWHYIDPLQTIYIGDFRITVARTSFYLDFSSHYTLLRRTF
jgi:hypothetical protein